MTVAPELLGPNKRPPAIQVNIIIQADKCFFSMNILHGYRAEIVCLEDTKLEHRHGRWNFKHTSLVEEAMELRAAMTARAE